MNQNKAVILVDPESSSILLREVAAREGYHTICLFAMSKDLWLHLYNSGTFMTPSLEILLEQYDLVIFEPEIYKILNLLGSSGFEIAAVIPASESGVNVSDIIATCLGLPCNDPCSINARRDKSVMKEVANKANLRCANYKKCFNLTDIDEFMKSNNYPVVIKTPSGAGTNLVFVCCTKNELYDCFFRIMKSPDVFGAAADFALLEEYISGIEYTVNLLADGKDLHVTDIWRYKKIDNQFAKNLYYDTILESPTDDKFSEVKDFAIRLAKAVDIKLGPVHTEIKVDKNGPAMIEIASRFGGSRIPYFIREYSNNDPVTLTLDAYINGKTKLKLPIQLKKHVIIVECPTEAKGKITAIHGLDRIKALQSYHSHSLSVAVGTFISPTVDLMGIPITVWLSHEDRDILLGDAEIVHKVFKIDTVAASIYKSYDHLEEVVSSEF